MQLDGAGGLRSDTFHMFKYPEAKYWTPGAHSGSFIDEQQAKLTKYQEEFQREYKWMYQKSKINVM